MRSAATIALVMIAVGMTFVAMARQDEKDASVWMKKKLEYSKNILEGITTEDFDAVRQSATAMRRMSELEGFARRRDTKAYRTQLSVFEFSNDELIRFAQEKNIDGASLAFAQLTLSCVNCHKQLRVPQQ
jgi:cytochrome c556